MTSLRLLWLKSPYEEEYTGFGRTDVALPELLAREGGRGRRPFWLERVEESVVMEMTLPGPDPSLWATEEVMLPVSLLEAGDPGLR